MLELLMDPNAWIALLTLTLLEIILGIDNIIFIAILVGKLPEHQRDKARIIGLGLAMGTRILLLLSLFWIMKLTAPLFTILANEISGRDLVLILGGLFLLWKSTVEIHSQATEEHTEEKEGLSKGKAIFGMILVQIAVIDIVFSLDSVITAVGMAEDVEVMIAAVVIAVGVMMWASKPISEFIEKHHTLKILALAFLILVGVALIAEGLDLHISKAYIYFAMAFSFGVEMINIYSRNKKAKANMLAKNDD